MNPFSKPISPYPSGENPSMFSHVFFYFCGPFGCAVWWQYGFIFPRTIGAGVIPLSAFSPQFPQGPTQIGPTKREKCLGFLSRAAQHGLVSWKSATPCGVKHGGAQSALKTGRRYTGVREQIGLGPERRKKNRRVSRTKHKGRRSLTTAYFLFFLRSRTSHQSPFVYASLQIVQRTDTVGRFFLFASNGIP